MTDVLVVYSSLRPLRATVADHLWSFSRYAGPEVSVRYVNAALPWARPVLARLQPDVIIFHTLLLSERWTAPTWRRTLRAVEPLKHKAALKIAVPQDEFFRTDDVCRFIREFGVTHVFSNAAASEWPKIYGPAGYPDLSFATVLTGYLEEETVERIDGIAPVVREIDIAYRAWRAEAWLGRVGRLKVEIADVVGRRAPELGLTTDISTDEQATFMGDDWYRFLLRSRCTLGVEGGASILDRDGSLMTATRAYVAEHPGASFEEIEEHCFPGRDGELALAALSPRHLEACATRTCQILVEGEYAGVLRPMEHYLPLRADFSNLDEILELARDESLRRGIVDRARADVVDSGAYTYRSFVERILLPVTEQPLSRQRRRAPGGRWATWGLRALDRVGWLVVGLREQLRRRAVVPLRARRTRSRLLAADTAPRGTR